MVWVKGTPCTCIAVNHGGRWKTKSGERIDGPRTRETLTVLGVDIDDEGATVLEFAEWPGPWYRAKSFRPIVPKAMAQDLEMFAHHL